MKKLHALIVVTLAAAIVAPACGGRIATSKPRYQPTPSADPTSSYSGGGASADSGGDYGGGYGGSYGGATTVTPEPAPTERPGLGTVWGENVSSYVTTKPFVRDTDSPFAAVALYYNDAEGVGAHAQYLGGAQPAPIYAYTPYGGISVALVDTANNVLDGLLASGRTLVVGAEGERYNLMITNNTPGRFEVVASVDGLDVIDGKNADLAKRGYILEPYSSLVVDGFRQSEYEVAAFRFGRVSGSYAARSGDDRNVGVVGFAFFAEEGSRWTTDELGRRDTANPFPGDRSYAQPPR
jgi:hypothetical protein